MTPEERLTRTRELHKETISIANKAHMLYLEYPEPSPDAIMLKAALDNLTAAKSLFHCIEIKGSEGVTDTEPSVSQIHLNNLKFLMDKW